ncbi:MAG: 23S rRNA (uracil(1939)-C(5))-methyltransferase RlmD [Desulfocapsaceae bacterium]
MNYNNPPVVTIEKMVNGGFGLGRLPDGRNVFVRHCLPGEIVSVALTRQKHRYGFGDVLEISRSSPERITPPCPYYRHCGGCDLQHTGYQNQGAIKQQILVELLESAGEAALKDAASLVAPPIGSTNQFHYRQRIRLNRSSNGQFGFRHFRSHEIVAVERCLLAAEPLNLCLADLSKHLKSRGFSALITITEELELLLNPLNGRVTLLLKISRPPRPADRKQAQRLGERLDQVDRVFFSGQRFALEGPFGDGEVQDRLLGFELPVNPALTMCWEIGGFSQVNIAQNFNLIDLVLRQADVAPSDRLLDLYCGMGNFSLPLARRAAEVYGIENQGSAVRSAKNNSSRNLLENCRFAKNDVAAGCQTLIDQQRTFDTVICDPPRRGIPGLAPRIAQLCRHKLVYISCDPATLCRDLADLTKNDFSVSSIQPIDMFPQTHHIESVVLLEKHSPQSRIY